MTQTMRQIGRSSRWLLLFNKLHMYSTVYATVGNAVKLEFPPVVSVKRDLPAAQTGYI